MSLIITGGLNSLGGGGSNYVKTEDLYNANTEIIKSEHLPSYVNNVLEFDHYSEFPAEGESGKIYVDKETNNTYRWNETLYALISDASVITRMTTVEDTVAEIDEVVAAALVELNTRTTALETNLDGHTIAKDVPSDAVFTDTYTKRATSIPIDGIHPNVFYDLGTLSSNLNVTIKAATDDTLDNEWMLAFSVNSTVPSITFPNTVVFSNAYTFLAFNHYEISMRYSVDNKYYAVLCNWPII